jgi:hypothetical protein
MAEPVVVREAHRFRRFVAESGRVPAVQLLTVSLVDHDEERSPRRHGRRGVGQARQRVAERTRAINPANGSKQAFDDGELCLALGNAGFDDSLPGRPSLLSVQGLEGGDRLTCRLALLGQSGPGFLERSGQSLGPDALGLDLGAPAVALGRHRMLHLLAKA